MKVHHFSRVRLCATPYTAAHQAPLSLGFSRQEHWSGLPFPSPMHESALKGETVPDSLPATPKSPPTRRVPPRGQRWRSSIQSAKTRPGAVCGSDHELLIAKFRLKLKKVGKTTRPFRYHLNQIPYTVEVRNRFKGLDLIDRVLE